MTAEWTIAPLGELVTEIVDRRGVTPLKLGSRFVATGFRVISAKLIKHGCIDFSADEPRFVNECTYKKWMRAPLLADDVILTSEAPLGEIAYMRESAEWCLGQRLFGIRTNKNLLYGRFLYYALQSDKARNELQSRTTGTTVLGIRQSQLRQVHISFPDIPEQRAIARILGALDDKIELNRRMNETLEAMARALFKSWFIDFDPVRAKAEGRDPGLPADIAALFPDTFQDSELGEIPKGWTARKLGELLEFAYGKALKGSDRRSGSVAVYGSNGQIGWHNEKLEAGPGIIVGRKGNPGIITWAPSAFYAIDTTFYVVPKPRCPSLYFLFFALQNIGLPSLGADSAVPGLNRNVAYLSAQLLPPLDVLRRFDQSVGVLFDRMNQTQCESRTLTTLRDMLLPRLLSGEMKLGTAGPTMSDTTPARSVLRVTDSEDQCQGSDRR